MLPRPASATAEPDRLERCDLPIPGSCRPQSIGQIGPEFQNRRELTARADHTVLSVRADHNGGDASRRGERGLRPAALVPVGPQGAVLMVCPYCGSDVGSSGVCEKCGAPREDVKLTGWRPDPTARHEGRYYVAGRPTSRVRNGRAEANDPAGGQMLPNYVDLPSRSRMSIRWSWLGTGVGAAIIVMVALVFWALRVPDHRQSESPDAIYLSTLQDAGLAGQFNFDANAIAHGKHVCRQLDDGGPQQAGRRQDRRRCLLPAILQGLPYFRNCHCDRNIRADRRRVECGDQLDRIGRNVMSRSGRILRYRPQHSSHRAQRHRRNPAHHPAWGGAWRRSHLHVFVRLSGHGGVKIATSSP